MLYVIIGMNALNKVKCCKNRMILGDEELNYEFKATR